MNIYSSSTDSYKREEHTDVRIDEERDRSTPAAAQDMTTVLLVGLLCVPVAPVVGWCANASQSFVDNIQASEETTVRTIRTEFDGTAETWCLKTKVQMNCEDEQQQQRTVEDEVQRMIAILHQIDDGFESWIGQFFCWILKDDGGDEDHRTDENEIEKIQREQKIE
jgi:hypothetical protein